MGYFLFLPHWGTFTKKLIFTWERRVVSATKTVSRGSGTHFQRKSQFSVGMTHTFCKNINFAWDGNRNSKSTWTPPPPSPAPLLALFREQQKYKISSKKSKKSHTPLLPYGVGGFQNTFAPPVGDQNKASNYSLQPSWGPTSWG